MPIYSVSNLSANNTQRILGDNSRNLSNSLEKLSSGFRINQSSDDASGLQISEQLRVQIRGAQKAIDNTQDGVNVLKLADGTYEGITNSLQRVRELVVQGSNDSNGSDQRNAIKSELDQLSQEIDRIVNTTTFNGKVLLNGSNTTYSIQVGGDGNQNNTVNVGSVFANNLSTGLAVDTANLTVDTSTNAQLTLNKLDTAIGTITSRRASLGAFINRLENSLDVLSYSVNSKSQSEARIRNIDVASESTKLVANQILQQASASLLSQANQNQQIASQILRG
jgi:flagellin